MKIRSIVASLLEQRRFPVTNAKEQIVLLPVSEYAVLRVLMENPNLHGPAISKIAGNSLSIATVYSCLRRLEGKYCAKSEMREFNVGGSFVRRKLWKAAVKSTIPCSTDPDAPHGFARQASHNAGRYVCECETWERIKK